MRGRCHVAFGSSTAFLGAHLAGAPPLAACVVGVGAGVASRLPDRFELKPLFKHRGVTHSIPFATVVTGAWLVSTVVVAPVLLVFTVGLVAGYWLHLIGDACTRTGVPGWPFRERVWLLPRGARVSTSTPREVVFVTVWVLTVIVLVAVT